MSSVYSQKALVPAGISRMYLETCSEGCETSYLFIDPGIPFDSTIEFTVGCLGCLRKIITDNLEQSINNWNLLNLATKKEKGGVK